MKEKLFKRVTSGFLAVLMVFSNTHTSHTYTAEVQEAGCGTTGYTCNICNTCGLRYWTDVTEAKGHAYTASGTNEWAEDCSSVDVTFACTRCDATMVVTGKPEPTSVITAPTCTTGGSTLYEAKVDNPSGGYVSVAHFLATDPLGHSVENEICTSCGVYGSCGEGVEWSYDSSTTTLTISGTGAMKDYYDSETGTPWNVAGFDTDITSVVIEDGVTSVGSGSFSGCSKLTGVTIPTSVTSIGKYAFTNCTSLSSVVIPEGVTEINRTAFSNCKCLTSVSLPSTLQTIGTEAFINCYRLAEVVIPAQVTSLGLNAFYNCEALKRITFEGNAPTIGMMCFTNVNATAVYPGGNSSWTADVMQGYGGILNWLTW